MSLSKLIAVIKTLDEKSMGRLDNYVHSSYFKVPAASVALFDYLHDTYPDFTERNTSTEVIGKKSKNISNYMKQARAGSELLDAILHFLALEDWQKSERSMQWHQYHKLRELDLFELFETEYRKFTTTLDNCPEQNIDTFYFRHLFTELSFNGFDAKLNRTLQNDITPTLRTLDEFYALKLLRYLCEVISRKQVLGTSYHQVDIDWLFRTLESATNLKYPYVYMFVNVYKMIAAETYEESEPHYKLIKSFIGEQAGETLPPDMEEAMSYAVNWRIFWLGKGYEINANEYLWWIELKIRYSMLLEDGKLLPITFRNVVTSAVISDRTPDWMLGFIKQYKNFLPQDYMETYVAFAEGLYNYKCKLYTKAVQFFLQAQAREEVIFNAIIRRWQYISAFEENPNDIDLLLNQLLAFEKYLQRNVQAFQHLGGAFTKFIVYSKKLLNVAGNGQRELLIALLNKEEYFPGKTWLISKLQ